MKWADRQANAIRAMAIPPKGFELNTFEVVEPSKYIDDILVHVTWSKDNRMCGGQSAIIGQRGAVLFRSKWGTPQ